MWVLMDHSRGRVEGRAMGNRWGVGRAWVCLVVVWLSCDGRRASLETLAQGAGCQALTCAAQGLDCGTAIDGCGGVLHCGTCPSGEACGGGGRPNVCGLAPCTRSTCESLGARCGDVPDGCGGHLRCGNCLPPDTCGGGGVPYVCGRTPCTPTTCAARGKNCGTVSDDCAGTLECGTCPDGETCGGGGSPNVCGPATCTPTTCAALGKNCGGISDGCGGTLECGTCASDMTCGAGGVPNVCGKPPCMPVTCSSVRQECGLLPDGCEETLLDCGTCPGDSTCGGGPAPNTCGPASCNPTTCAALGNNCGLVSNGCGGLLDCGACYGNETCGGGGVANVCGSAQCQPDTCAERGKDCGLVPDGCGGILECGTCSDGETCGGGGVANMCAPPVCRPYTCGQLGKTCGVASDGCGGMLECGTCALGESCGGGGVANVCFQPQPVCMDQDLGSALPVSLKGSTANTRDDHLASCGGQGAPDRAYAWRAPHAGVFTFDTARSAMRTLVSVRREDCMGEELACATSGISYGGGARVAVSLTAGQRVLVIVDSPRSGDFSSGDFELHIHERTPTEAGSCFDGADNDGDRWVDCADTDCQAEPLCDGRGCSDVNLGSALPVTYQGDTVHSGDGFQGTCGALLQPDRGHLWTAPRAGTFVFDTAGSDANALYLLTGCRGRELACAASHGSGQTGAPAVKLTLEKGQTVLVVVDGMARSDRGAPIRYTLRISEHGTHAPR